MGFIKNPVSSVVSRFMPMMKTWTVLTHNLCTFLADLNCQHGLGSGVVLCSASIWEEGLAQVIAPLIRYVGGLLRTLPSSMLYNTSISSLMLCSYDSAATSATDWAASGAEGQHT
jgi:hypothetical protein